MKFSAGSARKRPTLAAWQPQPQPPHVDTAEPVLSRSIGAILASTGLVSPAQVDQVLELQQARGMRFGEAAVALGMVDQEEVLWALAQQFHYPYAPAASRSRSGELVVASDPYGAQAEAFRELRTQLTMGVWRDDGARRALAVTSPATGDGKTFVAANLAIALSQLGAHTLLLDLDLRTPRQHALFELKNDTGLSNILAGRTEAPAIHPVPDLPTLFVLPVGATPPNPLELVQRPALGLLLRELTAKFDYLVVDTPATSHGADARLIAAACGAALAIGRPGASRMRALKKLVGALADGPAAFAGVVLNDR